MLKIFSGRNAFKEISVNGIRNIRKYGCECPKPEYECPHKKKPTSAERREQRLKSIVHPFLKKHCGKHSGNFWRLVFLTVCVPSIIAGYIIAFYTRPKQKRPPFVEYSYLRIRNRPFPWGDGNKTFIHNPYRNALPTGYELDEEDDE